MSHSCFSPVLHILLPVVSLNFPFLKIQASPFPLHAPCFKLFASLWSLCHSKSPCPQEFNYSLSAFVLRSLELLLWAGDELARLAFFDSCLSNYRAGGMFLWLEQRVSASALFSFWPFLGKKGRWVWKQYLVRGFSEASWTSCREYFWLNFSICSVGIKLFCLTWVVLQCLDIQWIKATGFFR